MENNNENKPLKQNEDNGAIWAVLLTLGFILIMVIIKQFVG